MNNPLILDVPIENIWQEEIVSSGVCTRIHFTQQGVHYYLDVATPFDFPAKPLFVNHAKEGENKCRRCEEEGVIGMKLNMCYHFTRSRRALFRYLIAQPAIRLHWVTKQHDYHGTQEKAL